MKKYFENLSLGNYNLSNWYKFQDNILGLNRLMKYIVIFCLNIRF